MSSEGFGNQGSCRVLEVSESGFDAWRNRPPSVRAMRHVWLTEIIRDIHTTSRGTYGARRVHADLILGRGLTVARCTVELLMQRAELAGLPGRRRHRAIHETPTASDLVDRNFAREEPNRLWVTDITEHSTREGKLYCAVCSIRSPAASWAGRSIATRPPAWSPVPCRWPSPAAHRRLGL